jgi:hypothetical protein
MIEKDNEPFGQRVTMVILVFTLSICAVTYTFNLFKPYMSCVAVQAQGEPVLTQQDRGPS